MGRRECVETKLDLMANNGHGKEYKKEEDKQLLGYLSLYIEWLLLQNN